MRSRLVDGNPVDPDRPHVLTKFDCACGFTTSGVIEETAMDAMQDHIDIYNELLGVREHHRIGRSHELLPDVREILR